MLRSPREFLGRARSDVPARGSKDSLPGMLWFGSAGARIRAWRSEQLAQRWATALERWLAFKRRARRASASASPVPEHLSQPNEPRALPERPPQLQAMEFHASNDV